MFYVFLVGFFVYDFIVFFVSNRVLFLFFFVGKIVIVLGVIVGIGYVVV